MGKQSVYWNINEPRSYNGLFYFIIGERGDGKTYGTKKFAIEDFLENGHEFVYVRRFENGMKKVKNKYFNDIEHLFPDHEFKVEGYTATCDDVVCGHFVTLSKAKLFKSTPFPNVRTIIFDEFLLAKGHHRYLPDEVDAFLNLYETINRTVDREIRGIPHCTVWFLANAISITNPYFLYFDLELPKNKKMISRGLSKDIVIQLVQSEGFKATAKKSRVGQMLGTTTFFKHAFENDFYHDRDVFIRPLPKEKQYLFTLKAVNKKYGVWRDRETNYYYVSEKHDPSCKFVYTTLLENHEPNTMLLKSGRANYLIKSFVEVFKAGGVFYDTMNTQNVVLESMKGLIR